MGRPRRLTIAGYDCRLLSGVSPGEVEAALGTDGAPLKSSSRSKVWKVGRFVLKASRGNPFFTALRLTFWKNEQRLAWAAARFLFDKGVGTPRPLALLERRFLGFTTASVLVTEYLEGFVDIEKYATDLLDEMKVRSFLEELSGALQRLYSVEAVHPDLKGPNIFTRMGSEIKFLDLDSVVVGHPVSRRQKLKNHIQILDAFRHVYDVWPAHIFDDFLSALVPEGEDEGQWKAEVRRGQKLRAERRMRLSGQPEKHLP